MITALSDSLQEIRRDVALAMGEMKFVKATEPQRLLRQEKNEPVRQQIGTAIQLLRARKGDKL